MNNFYLTLVFKLYVRGMFIHHSSCYFVHPHDMFMCVLHTGGHQFGHGHR